MLRLKRAWCYIAHWRRLERMRGFGWRGWWCRQCGYSFFADWDEDIKELGLHQHLHLPKKDAAP